MELPRFVVQRCHIDAYGSVPKPAVSHAVARAGSDLQSGSGRFRHAVPCYQCGAESRPIDAVRVTLFPELGHNHDGGVVPFCRLWSVIGESVWKAIETIGRDRADPADRLQPCCRVQRRGS